MENILKIIKLNRPNVVRIGEGREGFNQFDEDDNMIGVLSYSQYLEMLTKYILTQQQK